MSHNLDVAGYHDDRVIIDLSIARGLAYYNGPVFETILLDAPQFGSVFSGGRYDDLVMRFLGERVPATGASMGVDRLLAALRALEKVKIRKSTADVFVTTFDPQMKDDYIAMTWNFAVREFEPNSTLEPTRPANRSSTPTNSRYRWCCYTERTKRQRASSPSRTCRWDGLGRNNSRKTAINGCRKVRASSRFRARVWSLRLGNS